MNRLNISEKTKAKYDLFVTAYLQSFNGAKAAIEAGYSEKTAAQQSTRLLTNVYIKEKLDFELKRLRERMAEEGSRAFANLLNTFLEVEEKLRKHDEAQMNIAESEKVIHDINTSLFPMYDEMEKVKKKYDKTNGNSNRPLKQELGEELERLEFEIIQLERTKRPYDFSISQSRDYIIYPRDWEKIATLKMNLLKDILDRGGFKPSDKVELEGDVSLEVIVDYGDD